MGLLKKKLVQPERPETPAIDSGEDRIVKIIEYELDRAGRYGRPLSLIRAIVHLLPSESISMPEKENALAAVTSQLRNADLVGTLPDGSVIGVLPETTGEAAQVTARR